MDINTHEMINNNLCGTAVELKEGYARVEFSADDRMVADKSGLIHGGFIFGLADYAAMLAVNHPNVVLGAADVKFLKPVKLGDKVEATAKTTLSGKKNSVEVIVTKKDDVVFTGNFTCFSLEKHVLQG
ncbi:MAG: PaaI family thioesterase [Desulfobacterales bacterium]|nr:PaaI family thioesterase [Desulfobacterales bacterium]MCP4159171.1 PaaI family thioesterase [Deltaproteobacteria bacterium]